MHTICACARVSDWQKAEITIGVKGCAVMNRGTCRVFYRFKGLGEHG